MSSSESRSRKMAIAINLATVLIAYAVAAVLIQIGFRFEVKLLMRSAEVIAAAVGLVIAWRLNARTAAYVMYAALAYSIPLTAIRAIFGIQAAQGLETHLAVISAALLGVALGAWYASRSRLRRETA